MANNSGRFSSPRLKGKLLRLAVGTVKIVMNDTTMTTAQMTRAKPDRIAMPRKKPMHIFSRKEKMRWSSP